MTRAPPFMADMSPHSDLPERAWAYILRGKDRDPRRIGSFLARWVLPLAAEPDPGMPPIIRAGAP